MEVTFNDTILAAVIGVLAVAVGTILNQVLAIWSDTRNKKRELETAISTSAAICLDRLIKMKLAIGKNDSKAFDHEKDCFGVDTDRFLEAISSRKKIQAKERQIYEEMCRILMGMHPESELERQLENTISTLDEMIS
jgi:hypothetical protein